MSANDSNKPNYKTQPAFFKASTNTETESAHFKFPTNTVGVKWEEGPNIEGVGGGPIAGGAGVLGHSEGYGEGTGGDDHSLEESVKVEQREKIFVTGVKMDNSNVSGRKYNLFLPSDRQPINSLEKELHFINEREKKNIAEDKVSQIKFISAAVHRGTNKLNSKRHGNSKIFPKHYHDYESPKLAVCDICGLSNSDCSCKFR